MKRTPHAPNTLIQTLHRLRDLLQLLPIRTPQQQRLIQNLMAVHISNADGFFATVDVLAFDDGVFVRSGRDGDFDAGVFFREGGEFGFEEVAVVTCQMTDYTNDGGKGGGRTSCHDCYRPSRSSGNPGVCIGG